MDTPDLNEIVQKAIHRGKAQYTVGPGNLDRVIGLVTNDAMSALEPMVQQIVTDAYREVRG